MNSRSPEKFLAQCTVRIQAVGKSGYGTGFFVAPNLILTCAHVVRKNKQTVSQINLWWQDQSKPLQAKVERIPEAHPGVDIALLKVLNLTNQDWLITSFDTSYQTGDELYTFGYPDNNPEGEPGTFEIIGLTGNKPPLIKFKEGQVRPGFSGSPLLNLRTGKVCGIINKTLDRSSDLGGKGVPTSVIFTYFPELKSKTIPANPFIPLSGKIDIPDLVFGREKDLTNIFSSDQTSPFENVCIELEVKPWQESTIRDFINHRLANNVITFSESEIAKIIIDSHGLPQKVMQLCHQLYQLKIR